jgi:fatty-acyl-CoA synthase
MVPNIPEVLEAHYGVPIAGAMLNLLNIRLNAGWRVGVQIKP